MEAKNSTRYAVLALLGFFITAGVQAQAVQNVNELLTLNTSPTIEAAPTSTLWTTRFVTDLESTAELTHMDAAFWKSVRKENIDALRSRDGAVREEALQNIIFFSRFYPEQARFESAANRLYKIYERSSDQTHRLMALVALDLVGTDGSMRSLARSVRLEQDARIQQATLAVLGRYYAGNQ